MSHLKRATCNLTPKQFSQRGRGGRALWRSPCPSACSGRARGHGQSSKREMPQPLPVLRHSHRKRNKKSVLVNLSTLGLSTYADTMSRQDIQSGFTLVTSLQCTQQGAPAGLWSWAACYSSTRDTREAAYYTESPKVYGRGVTSLVGTEQTLPALWSAETCTACTCCLAQPA